jgi:indole-3-glycerol phosphate synthase
MIGGKVFIAEVKTQSPFGFKSKYSWDELFETALVLGDMISIHTDSLWGGSFDLIEKAKKQTNKLILAKGIHENDDLVKNAFDSGADWVLVVGRKPKYKPEKCFIEPYSLQDLKDNFCEDEYPNLKQSHIVWNSRNLLDGSLKKENIEDVRQIYPDWLCQASNIKSESDISKHCDAFLVGEHLMSFDKDKYKTSVYHYTKTKGS